MKILCVADPENNGSYNAELLLKVAAEFFGSAEIVVESMPENSASIRDLEKSGPNAFGVPEAFRKHNDAGIVIGGSICPFSRESLELFEHLKIIGTCRGGLENVDMAAARELGLMVVNGYGRNSEAVADFALALILAETRSVARGHEGITKNPESDAWPKNYVAKQHVKLMRDCKVGIFGFGHVGGLVAQKLSGFKCEILVHDPFVPDEEIKALGYLPADKETLFKESDIITVHSRLVDATKGIISKKEISMMKPSAFFINDARAGLVDYDALLDALKNHRIAGAGLDVFPEEPLPAGSEWKKLDNCTITPHMAAGVPAARVKGAGIVAENVINALKLIKAPQIITKELFENAEYAAWAKKALAEIGLNSTT